MLLLSYNQIKMEDKMEKKFSVANVETTKPVSRFPNKENSSQQRKNSKENEKKFRMEEKKEQSIEVKPKSTIWEIYEIARRGEQIRKEKLTGSNLHDIYQSVNQFDNNSLLYRLYQEAIQKKQREEEIAYSKKREKK